LRTTSIIAGVLLASSLFVMPAQAGLLGNVVSSITGTLSGGVGSGGGSSGGSGSSSSSSGGGTTTIGVPGVVTISTNQNGGTHVDTSLLGGGGSTVNVGLSNVLGGTSNLGVTLPGTGTGLDSTLGSVTNTVNGITGNGGTVDNLLGSVTDGVLGGGGLPGLGGGGGDDCGLLGCYDGGGGNGGGGGGGGGNGGHGHGGGLHGLPPVYGGGGGGGMMGMLGGAGGACISNSAGLVRLLHTRYDASMMGVWNRAGSVRLIPIRLCPQLRAQLARAAAGSGDIAFLRGVAAAFPAISSTLARGRYGANNVIGMDAAGGVLSVYVF